MIITAKPGTVTVIPPTIQQPKPGQPYGKKLRVAAYCRVSSEKDEQLNSFEVQVGYYTEKIASNPEWKMAGIFADEGISGTSLRNRDEFKRMLRHCREGRIDLILVKSVSRFGRNTVDVMRTVRALQGRNIGVLFEKESLDTRHMNSEMMLAFHSAFSQSESESIRGNIIWGQEKRRQNGVVAINPGMFGFCKDADGQIAIDEEQATAIRMIYQAYLDGDSLSAIKHRLEYFFIDLNEEPSLTENARCLLENQDAGIGKFKGGKSGVFVEGQAPFSIPVQDADGNLHYGKVRKLMPIECWRLQGFSDEQFHKAADTGLSDAQLYKMAGNAVTVPVISALGQKIKEVFWRSQCQTI